MGLSGSLSKFLVLWLEMIKLQFSELVIVTIKQFSIHTLSISGYWPSYNVPFYEEVYNRSGYPDVVKTRGTDYSYQLAPRAKIFRRDQGNVKDMESMKAIMRYNG